AVSVTAPARASTTVPFGTAAPASIAFHSPPGRRARTGPSGSTPSFLPSCGSGAAGDVGASSPAAGGSAGVAGGAGVAGPAGLAGVAFVTSFAATPWPLPLPALSLSPPPSAWAPAVAMASRPTELRTGKRLRTRMTRVHRRSPPEALNAAPGDWTNARPLRSPDAMATRAVTFRGLDVRSRVTPRAGLAAIAAVSLALGLLSLLAPTTPTYDPWAWLIWGREVAHLDLDTQYGPSWKPLPVLLTTPFALVPGAAPAL